MSLVVTVLFVEAHAQELSSLPMLLPEPAIQETALAPTFASWIFKLRLLDESGGTPDASPDISSSTEPRERFSLGDGLCARRRISQARILSYGAAFFTRFMARDHWASDMFLGTGLGLGIAENTFHAHCNPEFESQCKHHQWWWKAVKVGIQ